MRKIVEVCTLFPMSVTTEYKLDKVFKNSIRITVTHECGTQYKIISKMSWRRFKKTRV